MSDNQAQEKEIRWMGSSYADLLAFPEQDKVIAEARYRAVVTARKARP